MFKFSFDKIYDVYSEEFMSLYEKIINVGCSGDLYFDIKVDCGEVKVEK